MKEGNKMANAKNSNRGRGRPATLETGKQRAAVLATIGTENEPSRFIKMQLAEAGLIAFEPVQTGSRGRPALQAVVTGKGRSLLNLSKRWQ
jgi:hypothetical protein